MGKSKKNNEQYIEVFFSENSNVFYIKCNKEHSINKDFKTLVNCSEEVFNGFLKDLEKKSVKPSLYSFKEMKNQVDQFLIKHASNIKH